jgi:LPXTG-motif cell wall-anchored protein
MRIWGTFLLAAALVAAPTAASAADGDHYVPVTPPENTLSGSALLTECDNDEPVFRYDVRLVRVADDPGSVETGVEGPPVDATLMLTSGQRSVSVDLGTFTDEMSGVIPWPDDVTAFVEATPAGQAITAQLEVDPVLADPLAVPFDILDCAPANPLTAGLAVTGGGGVAWGVAAGAAALVAAGGFLVVRRRRTRA